MLNGWLVTTMVGLKMRFIRFHSENCTEKQPVKDVALGELMRYVCVCAGVCVESPRLQTLIFCNWVHFSHDQKLNNIGAQIIGKLAEHLSYTKFSIPVQRDWTNIVLLRIKLELNTSKLS